MTLNLTPVGDALVSCLNNHDQEDTMYLFEMGFNVCVDAKFNIMFASPVVSLTQQVAASNGYMVFDVDTCVEGED